MPKRDNKTIRVSCRISQPDFVLLEAVAKRGGYTTLSELIRDALIHMTHAVIDRASRPNRSAELRGPMTLHPTPWSAAGNHAEGSVEMDIRSIFEDAQSLGVEFEDDYRKRNSK